MSEEREQNYSAVDGMALRRVSRMTPEGDWVWAWQSAWQLDADAAEGRSIVENELFGDEEIARKMKFGSESIWTDVLDVFSMTQCPYYNGNGACASGCYAEPRCRTDEPTEGWIAYAITLLSDHVGGTEG